MVIVTIDLFTRILVLLNYACAHRICYMYTYTLKTNSVVCFYLSCDSEWLSVHLSVRLQMHIG